MATEDYLEQERKKLWDKVTSLQNDLDAFKSDVFEKIPDLELVAEEASKSVKAHETSSLESKQSIDVALSEIKTMHSAVSDLSDKVSIDHANVKTVSKLCDETQPKLVAANEEMIKLRTALDEYDDCLLKIEGISVSHKEGEEANSKIMHLHTASLKRKDEIDKLYLSIFGYKAKDEETGELRTVEGLKDELDNSYTELESSIESANTKLDEIYQGAETERATFISDKTKEFERQINYWRSEHTALTNKIKELLPDALTTGLSHAFSEKRKSEISSGRRLYFTFFLAILLLVCVSLIPFFVNYHQFNEGKLLDEIINDIPKTLALILPMYIPIAWLAYSSSKKLNLSKRLVEEYTHKEVLSKTFEGLSSQIESISDEGISSDLRIKLLYNLLDVSAENPGKLISNYDSTDHPLIEILESSSKLGTKMEKLDRIPGLSKLSKILNDRMNNTLKKQGELIEEVLESADDLVK